MQVNEVMMNQTSASADILINGAVSFPEDPGMSIVTEDLTTAQLMKLAADYNAQRVTLTDEERRVLVALLKLRAAEELDYGQEIECESVRVVRRVTGAVGVYFKS